MTGIPYHLGNRQSELINAMRFPLIVLVVYAHSAGSFDDPTIPFTLEGWNVYHFFAELLCRHLCSIGTCCFFVISGYFFFLNAPAPGPGLSFQWIPVKWKKRLRTLLVPYLIWNALAVLAVYAKVYGLDWLGINQETEELEFLREAGPLYWFVTGPADFPLWFMRDLMIMTLLTPFLYWLFSRIPKVALLMLALFYLAFPRDLPFLSMRGFFFFSLGAWAGIQKQEFLPFCQRWKSIAAFAAVILAVVATFRTGYADHFFWLRLFYPFGMITFLNMCYSFIVHSPKRESRLIALSSSVFFIYAAHEIYVLGWTKGFFVRLFGDGLTGSWIRLLLAPAVVLLICLAIYFILNKIMPRTLAFCCGGRTAQSGKR